MPDVRQTALRAVDSAIPGDRMDYRDLFGGNRTGRDRLRAAGNIGSSLVRKLGPLGLLAGIAGRRIVNNTNLSHQAAWDRLSDTERETLEAEGVTTPEQWEAYMNSEPTISSTPPSWATRPQSGSPNSPIQFPQFNPAPTSRPTVTVGDINTSGSFGPMPQINPQTGEVTYPSTPYTHRGDEVNSGPPRPDIVSNPNIGGGSTAISLPSSMIGNLMNGQYGGFGGAQQAFVNASGNGGVLYGGTGGVPQGLGGGWDWRTSMIAQ